MDTSSPTCSVSVAENGVLIAEHNTVVENAHASILSTTISQLIATASISYHQLSAIAISAGPGSYTGLRIGVSLAKGLSYGLDIPFIAISTLEAMAYSMAQQQPDSSGIYIPMIDARHSNIYTGIYDSNCQNLLKDTFIPMNEYFFNIYLRSYENRYFGGRGISEEVAEHGTLIENICCISSNMVRIAYDRYIKKEFEDIAYYEPNYLKEYEVRIKSK